MWMKQMMLQATIGVQAMMGIVMNTFTLDGFKTWFMKLLSGVCIALAAYFAIHEFKKKSVANVFGVIILGGFIFFFINYPEKVLGAVGGVIDLFFGAGEGGTPNP